MFLDFANEQFLRQTRCLPSAELNHTFYVQHSRWLDTRKHLEASPGFKTIFIIGFIKNFQLENNVPLTF